MRRFLFLCGFLASMAGIYVAGRMLVAAVYMHQVDQFLEDWSEKKAVPSEVAWDTAYRSIRKACDTYPSEHGGCYERLGQVLEWKVHAKLVSGAEAGSYQQHAIAAYALALDLNPTWPYTWMNFAMAKLRASEFDVELRDALAKALQYGPLQPDILLKVAYTSLLLWDFHEDFPLLAEQAIEQGMRVRKMDWGTLFYLVYTMRRHEEFCSFVPEKYLTAVPICKFMLGK